MPGRTRSRMSRARNTRAETSHWQHLRPVTIWVPDVSSPGFAEEAHRQSLAIVQSENESADQDFVDAISEPGSKSGAA
jgi:Protein  of unknown function (DUF3018)